MTNTLIGQYVHLTFSNQRNTTARRTACPIGPRACLLLLVLFLTSLTLQAAPPLKKWTGTASTDWNTAANWTPAAVPVAGDSVRVDNLGSQNQPVIAAGTLAKAKNVYVGFGNTLTINSNGSLELASTLNVTALGITDNGTMTNNGTLIVKSGFEGIDVSGSFVNNGTIILGEPTSNPYSFGEEALRVYSSGDNFTNNSNGVIKIYRPANNGILLFLSGASFTNYGTIKVWETGLSADPDVAATGDGIDARGGTFVNESSGDIFITKTSANGFNCRNSGSVTNKGQITIRNVGLTPTNQLREGINVGTATFDNRATGQIDIDTTSNNGILNQGNFINSGQIAIGAHFIDNIGVSNLGNFDNKSGATLTIANTRIGVLSGGFGGTLTNRYGGSISIDDVSEDGIALFGFGGFDNYGLLNIGNSGDIGRYGIDNAAQFLNQYTADLNILNTANTAIHNVQAPSTPSIEPYFINSGQITVGEAANNNSTIAGIENGLPATFKNADCGELTTYQKIINADTLLNDGFLIALGTVAHSNSGKFINNGVIHDPNNTFNGVSLTNNDFIVYKASGECVMTNALKKGTGANVTIGGTWYKDQALTLAAGTYSQAANTFTVTNLSEGTHTLYFKATDNQYNCSRVFSIEVTYDDVTKPSITCPSNKTANLGANCTVLLGAWSAVSTNDNCNPSPAVTQSPVAATVLSGHNTVQIVTLTASDGNGNSASCTFTVTVKDVSKPSITCPANQNINLGANCSVTLGTWSPASSSDNCNPSPVVTQSPVAATVLSGHNTVQIVTLTANDGNGNSATCTFTVTAKDVSKPSITCPANQNINLGSNCTAALGAWNPVAVSDNCNPSPVVTQSPASATVLSGHNTVQTVTLTANDGNGNTEFCTFTVTAKDVTKPSITCPGNQEINLGANCTVALGTWSAASASDNCTASPAVTQSPASATVISGHNTVQTVTMTADDGNGNTESCQFTVTAKDNTKPSLLCPAPVTVTCAAAVPLVNLDAVNAADNCGVPVKSHVGDVTSNQTCINRKTVTRTYQATDAANNSTTCAQVITVFDNVQPVFSAVPANITVLCNAIPAVGSATATDGCSGAVTVAYNGQTITAGNCPDAYTITRHWTATDACGNTKTATQKITVVDVQAPVFTSVPANVTVQCNALPAVGNPSATDGCDASVSISYNGQTLAAGACPDTYTITRTWTAVDNCGNTRTATQRITVVDTQKPAFTFVPAPVTVECSDPVPPAGTPTATDNCDAAVDIALIGQYTTSAPAPNAYLLVRVWKATDNCSNYTTSSQVITVQDTQKPVFTSVPASITIECSDPFPVVPGTATATDNCDASVQVSFSGQTSAPGSCPQGYVVTRSWVAYDDYGNTQTATQTITVVDTEAPVFTNAPANIILACGADLPPVPSVSATDACDNTAPVTYVGETSTGPNCPYTVTRTWTTTDDCGNAATHTQIITVSGQTFGGGGGSGLKPATLNLEPKPDPRTDAARQTGATHNLQPVTLQLAPNPARAETWVTLELETASDAVLSLYDASGRLALRQSFTGEAGTNRYRLDLAEVPAGVYALQVLAGGQAGVKPLVVAKD